MSDYDDILTEAPPPAPRRHDPDADRLAIFYLSGPALLRFLSEGIARPLRTEGLPADARFVDAHYLYDRRCFAVTVWSATFERVPENVMPPLLWVKVTPEGFECDSYPPPNPLLAKVESLKVEPGSFFTNP